MLQIIDFKHLIKCWKAITLSDSASNQVPSGFLAVYVGEARVKFLIPARFLNLPIFVHLLNIAGEEYGFKFSGGIVLPCDVGFFKQLLKFLEKNEKKYGSLEGKQKLLP
ncbi:auxin-induced protein X15-like [Mangifera indica]|uniref:auxin-induced protein X15-like n=1 Tax=Mangifera indica TaxID=29780 RepID=UPI001CF9B942|nr:auxin-induced protein X15-like [Mangifera indica]